jgi:hypothetical protein
MLSSLNLEYLDAQSAFDVVLPELLVRNLFFCNTTGHSLLYLNNRFQNRNTFIDWQGHLMGPIADERGLEQGGVNSSDHYKIFSKEQLHTAQESNLGVPLGNLTVSGIGQADDTALVTNDIHCLQYLLHLSQVFCKKYHVKLCADKTKLQAFSTKETMDVVEYAKATNPIQIDDYKIDFVESAEHVGMVRNTSGNLPAILTRIIAHKKALGAVLHAGVARGHRGNPAASLHVIKIYGLPVLLSGLAPLLLSKAEEGLIEKHHKEVLMNTQRLLPCTPRPVTCFLAGSLPGTALLHLRQLTVFGMICRLPENILHTHAVNIFCSITQSSKSWFLRIRELCLQYLLPHPLQLLTCPLPKEVFKNLIKKHVVNHWEQLLRHEAAGLDSLVFFDPSFMSLTKPHPIWTTAGSSPAKVAMASVQAKMISGRFRTELLCSHWLNLPVIKKIALEFCSPTSPHFCQFLLDCSVLPPVILAVQEHGINILDQLFQLTRTWVYTLHKARMRKLCRWNLL